MQLLIYPFSLFIKTFYTLNVCYSMSIRFCSSLNVNSSVIGWEKAIPLAFHLCCFYFSVDLIVGVPFPFGVYGKMRNSIVSVPDHCLFIYFT